MNNRDFSEAILHLSDIVSNYENILKAFSNIDVVHVVEHSKDIKKAKEYLSEMESAYIEKIDSCDKAIAEKEEEESEKEKLLDQVSDIKKDFEELQTEYREFENSILVRFANN